MTDVADILRSAADLLEPEGAWTRAMKLVYDVSRREWPGAALTAPAVARPDWRSDVANGTCSIDGCGKATKTRGWCNLHYKRWRAHGTTVDIRPTTTERFWSHVDRTPGSCWLWTRAVGKDGYGRFGVAGRVVLAHRFAYESVVGPIPTALQLDHLCRVRACVNPTHLEPVTNRENGRRGLAGSRNRAKTHCSKGHPYDEQNTRQYRGRRYCRACTDIYRKQALA